MNSSRNRAVALVRAASTKSVVAASLTGRGAIRLISCSASANRRC